MWRDIKKGFRLMKYSYNFKWNIVTALFFVALSLFFMCLDVHSFVIGGVYFFLGMIMMLQMNYNLLYSQMISASGKKRFMDIHFPNFINNICTVGAYLLVGGLGALFANLRPEDKQDYVEGLITIAILFTVVIIYYSVCYKFFVVSTIIFAISFAVVYVIGYAAVKWIFWAGLGINIVAAFFIGFVVVLIGCLLSNLIRKALYQFPISSLAMGASLKKAMKY
ncbi:MAG: hypothetical protein IJ379_02570 [Lachnospiraceae bacterium]|nr:hypothetical protein [Lachnospiraceae bacterium]